MNCPKCGSPYTRILDTKRIPDGLRRHRVCNERKCRERFATMERIEVWDHTVRQYVEPEPGLAVVEKKLAPLPKQQEPRVARYTPKQGDPALSEVYEEAKPLLLQWWNESRRSKHSSKATWTRAAWESSVKRVSKLPQNKQILLAEAGVENGWMALKVDYLDHIAAKPAATGRPMPKDPSMLAALDEWPSQYA